MQVSCIICGKLSYRRPSHFKRVKRIFCSHECRGLWQRGKNNIAWKGGNVKITCIVCGKQKEVYRSQEDRKYCSHKCKGLNSRGEKNANYNSVLKECDYCGKDIKVFRCLLKQKNFCSRDCANKYHSKRMVGKGNPAWKNGIGKEPYGFEFIEELKKNVRIRDNYICRLCNLTNEEHVLVWGFSLATHHVDYDKHNNIIDNLISLCYPCHCKTNYNREVWKKKLLNLLKE